MAKKDTLYVTMKVAINFNTSNQRNIHGISSKTMEQILFENKGEIDELIKKIIKKNNKKFMKKFMKNIEKDVEDIKELKDETCW